MKAFDLVAVGELLMDMTPVKTGEGQAFIPNPGGAPCNFLAMAQKMGAKTAFIGKVGKDQFGIKLKNVIEAVGIDTQGLVLDDTTPTTLAFVHLTEEGDRSFSFYRKGCSDVSLKLEEVDTQLVEKAKCLYFGSLSFTDEPTRSTAKKLIEVARENNLLICYDPNYRPLLWASEAVAIEAMASGLKDAHVLKVSDEEARLLTGETDLEKAALSLHKSGVALVLVTLGSEGTLVAFKGKTEVVSALKVEAVDTTGAGDAFFGTFMHQLITDEVVTGRPDQLELLSFESLMKMVKISNVAAGLCVQGYGAIPALPSREAVMTAMTVLESEV